jgi:glycogen debranching enzyme
MTESEETAGAARTTLPAPEGEVIPNRFGPDTRHDFHVLKDGDLFAVFPASGDVNAPGTGIAEARSKDGLYFRDTRYLSRLSVSINGTRLTWMGHDSSPDGVVFQSELANTRLTDSMGTEFDAFELHVRRDRFLSDGLFDRIEVTNYGISEANLDVVLECWADFRDIFEVRGAVPIERGESLAPRYGDGLIEFDYATADGRLLSSRIGIEPEPVFNFGRAHIELKIPPKERRTIRCVVEVSEQAERSGAEEKTAAARHVSSGQLRTDHDFARSGSMASARMARRIERTAGIVTSRPAFNAWLSRSSADLAMLTSDLTTGPYPYAGVPWFAVPFGRDGLITAMQTLWLDAELAGGVLDFLAATQSTERNAFCDAEPGKILHEHRSGELARTGAVPFHHYYGGIDQTLLFIVLAHDYWMRTADLERLRRLEPAIRSALDWAAVDGDRDGDGFIEYERSSETGLRNQGWKDSEDAVFHADGTLCVSPVALVEVQGYLVAALRAAAGIFEVLGTADDTAALRRRADEIVQQIDDAFWDENLGTYCIALDSDNRPVRISTSNAGHLPFAGAALPKRTDRLFDTLNAPALRSGWGIRTVSTGAARYNPMGYHNGSVWPHDNSLIAAGAARYGRTDLACMITSELFDASWHFQEHRLPELWCGLPRDGTSRPVAYPSACAPQAWAAGAPFLCLQACLGITIDAPNRRVRVADPALPDGLERLELNGLTVQGLRADLVFRACGEGGVEVEVTNADAGLQVDLAATRRGSDRA